MAKIKVYGTDWCGDCVRAKSFMDNNNITYDWTNVDEETQYQEYITGLNNGEMRVPTIVFVDGSILIEPTNEELSEKFSIDL
ncbi:MAG: glutaredoxin domain-containing protein [Chloroflexota bacterium]|jgi:glutaredoxin|nr:glutaredoxin domain-containing protein [Chloroflexota bacterium]MEC9321119.1 glutaredoxin domain-containing protein [Chloroflexota bacterium]|tara:strand:- start:569 stop:814 length:246 start_codon:yes stop_codon:yes gene_type:complete